MEYTKGTFLLYNDAAGTATGWIAMRKALGYVRVSTFEQATSGLGLADQRATITAEAGRRGWSINMIADEGYSAKTLRRPGIAQALDLLSSGSADVLVVAKLDRLSRSLIDFAGLMERARKEGWELVVLDLGVDTTSPNGAMIASVMAAFAEYERRLISERTANALAQFKANGGRLGRPSKLPREIVDRIREEREGGATLREIAEGLDGDGVPTAQGGARWYPSTVRRILRAAEPDASARAVA